jgi:tRNA A37 threonylcarbamoyladenosine biosynthesis protein TsaE
MDGRDFISPMERALVQLAHRLNKKKKNMILVLQGSLPAGPAQVPRASGKAKQ